MQLWSSTSMEEVNAFLQELIGMKKKGQNCKVYFLPQVIACFIKLNWFLKFFFFLFFFLKLCASPIYIAKRKTPRANQKVYESFCASRKFSGNTCSYQKAIHWHVWHFILFHKYLILQMPYNNNNTHAYPFKTLEENPYFFIYWQCGRIFLYKKKTKKKKKSENGYIYTYIKRASIQSPSLSFSLSISL